MMKKSILSIITVVGLLISSTVSGQFYPEKHEDLSYNEFEKYTKKLKAKYEKDDDYGIAFYLATLKASNELVGEHLKKAIEKNPEDACESIYRTQYLANHNFYKTIYKNDTLTFQKAFNQCLEVQGENSFEQFLEAKRKDAEAHQQSLPQIDSTIMDVALIKTLEQLLEDDQQYRKKIDELKNTKEENERIWKKIVETDAINLAKVDSILKNLGCPTPATVGNELFRSIFLVLHHQSDLAIRKKYRPVIEEHYPGGTLDLYDRRTSDLKSSQTLDTMYERVDKCLENAEITEFVLSETSEKGFSHDVEETCIVGSVLPVFETTDIDNKTIDTQNLNGRVNVINFWFTQCKLCIEEMPFFNTLVDQFSDEEVNFIAMNKDDIEETKRFLTTREFNFNIIPDANNIIKNKLNMIWGYPLTIITDKQNRIVAVFNKCTDQTCKEELTKTIETHL